MSEPNENKSNRVTSFIEYLRDLAEREDRGAFAALRRGLLEPTGIAMSACPYVVRFLPSEPRPHQERVFFLVGALFALHPEHAEGVSLGHAFRRINRDTPEGQKGRDNASTRARFVALLDAHPDDVAEHVRHAVSLARAKQVGLDWVRTLSDLLAWGSPARWVQRRLANDFWADDSADAAAPTDESESVQ